ncbi:arsenate reductase ArsC [Hyphomonadaceae bacterium BL14]|nr:arsenate reductase ArsC [Hyphomonadaceae bacterium BL14]
MSGKTGLMAGRAMNVLILCTGNSARSILGEALFAALGEGRVTAFSAGSNPKGQPHPEALATLARHGHDISGFRSKRWDEFEVPGAPVMDAVITVCDSAASEPCPVWPGAPSRAHWGLPDPAHIDDPDTCRAAFEATYAALDARVRHVLASGAGPHDPKALSAALKAAHEACS